VQIDGNVQTDRVRTFRQLHSFGQAAVNAVGMHPHTNSCEPESLLF
jgi:hypothetical protein